MADGADSPELWLARRLRAIDVRIAALIAAGVALSFVAFFVEAVRRIKNSSKTSAIPIVAITGSATPEARKNALDLGAVDCIEKPVDVEKLAELLKKLIEGGD
jgi:DNA-binding NtrC family response regulator